MKRPRYEERQRYEADENQAGTVTFSLISTSFFTAKVCPFDHFHRYSNQLIRVDVCRLDCLFC